MKKQRMRAHVLSAVWSFVLAASLPADAANSDHALAGLDAYIDQARADWKNVGLAVAVVHGDEVVYARGFGVRESGTAAKVDAQTLFQVGSTTKAFTTAALGILVDEGKIRWDDPVIQHVPELRLKDPWLTRHLTIRDTVTHRSGISEPWYYLLGKMDTRTAIDQLRHIDAAGAFRDSFDYSNLMYAVAGRVVEAASGMSWHQFVETKLLRPLDMSRSFASPYEVWDAAQVAPVYYGAAPAGRPSARDARHDNVAMPHGFDESGSIVVLPWQSFDAAAPAGSIVSSATDLANWLIVHLNEGRLRGRAVLRKETLDELHAVQNLHFGFNEPPIDETTAMGWFRGEYRDDTHLEHGGGIIGFPAYVAMLLDRRIGVVVLSNGPQTREGGLHKSIAFWIFDRLSGARPADLRQQFLARMRDARRSAQETEQALRASRVPDTQPSLRLDDYAGRYEDRARRSGAVTIQIENGKLVLSFDGVGAYSGSLDHWHHDVFRLRSKPGMAAAVAHAPGFDTPAWQFVGFTLDAAGEVRSMSAFGANFERLRDGAAPRQ